MDKDYRERMREEAAEEVVPRRMFIRKQDLEEHGYTFSPRLCVDFERNGEAGAQRGMQKEAGKGAGNDGASKEGKEESRRIRREKNGGRRRGQKKKEEQ